MKWWEVFGLIGIAISVVQLALTIFKNTNWKLPTSVRTRADYVWGVSLALAAAVIWSLSYVSLSWASATMHPVEINVILLGTAAVVLAIGAVFHRALKRLRRPKATADTIEALHFGNWARPGPWVVLTGNVGSFLFFIFALVLISASQTIALTKVNPLFVAILAFPLLKRQIPLAAWLAVVLVVVGSILITYRIGDTSLTIRSRDELWGSILAVAGGFCFALYTVGLEMEGEDQRRLRLEFLALIFVLSYLAVVSYAYFTGAPASVQNWHAFLVVAANGVRVAVVYLLYWAAVNRIGALLTSVLVAAEVFLTMLFDSLLLSRPPSIVLVFGSIMIIASGITLILQSAPRET